MTTKPIQVNGQPARRGFRLPNFFLVGAMKAGTTTLYSYLNRHPQVFLPPNKEPQFFSRDHVYERGLDWYSNLFLEASPEQVCGEASTCYSRWPFFPHAAQRLAESIPDARLIFILRHPVQRIYSHYKHEMRNRFSQGQRALPSFEDFVEEDEESRCASHYALQIEHLCQFFDQDQLCILFFEDLIDNPRMVLGRVQSFIGVEECVSICTTELRMNSAAEAANTKIPRNISKRITGRFRQMPMAKRIIDHLPVRLRQQTRKLVEGVIIEPTIGRLAVSGLQEHITPMSDLVRQKLCRQYAADIKFVESITGRALPEWTR